MTDFLDDSNYTIFYRIQILIDTSFWWNVKTRCTTVLNLFKKYLTCCFQMKINWLLQSLIHIQSV